MSRVLLYTAIFGGRDQLRALPAGCEGLAFVDDPQLAAPAGWTLLPPHPEFVELSPRRRARAHKLLPQLCLPPHEVSLWVDGTHTPKRPLVDYLFYLGKADICLYTHSRRNCVYQEIEACKALQKDAVSVLEAQAARYHAAGYPHNEGLWETPVVLRRASLLCNELNLAWYDELTAGSVRDQVSLPVVLRRFQIEPARFLGRAWDQWLFEWQRHQA